jgi:cyclase
MKRIIFSLLYDEGQFVLSRNFRKQKVGDINWLLNNYNFSDVSLNIDEIIIIDVSFKKNINKFCNIIKIISKQIFIPITVGGGIKNIDDAKNYLDAGADKILINKLFHINPDECKKIAINFGKQFIVACIDYRIINNEIKILYDHGTKLSETSFNNFIKKINKIGFGEIILQSIDRDGTGVGLDLSILKKIKKNNNYPVILQGGIGLPAHILSGLRKNVDAVCTANLFNFIHNTFSDTRNLLIENKINIVEWNNANINEYNNKFRKYD